MNKVIVGIIGLAVGAVGGTMFGGSVVGGTAAGVGIATGLNAGICLTVTAAEEEGFLTEDQVGQVLERVVTDAGGVVPEDQSLANGRAGCAKVLGDLGVSSS